MSGSNENSSPSPSLQRRVARVDKWLSKGFGFAIDLGRLDTSSSQNTGYGWLTDEYSGTQIFVYHTALVCQNPTNFHRLYEHE